MAFDHTLINLAANCPEETRIFPPATTSARVPDLFFPNPNPPCHEFTSLPAVAVTHADATGFPGLGLGNPAGTNLGQAPGWASRMPAPVDPAPTISSSITSSGCAYTPISGFRVSGYQTAAAFDQTIEDTGNNFVSGKKVKFLCSFGGKILPRPSDGMLRYVGGQTRIFSVRRDVTFEDLVQKMVDTYGQPVVIKYQLPDEDLDALVTVSCSDDLDNMMDEYEKLLERSPDGSAKLRVFLFSVSELDPTGFVQLGVVHNTGHKYVDAVNGIVEGIGGGITRKESIASLASTQNSDVSGTDALDALVGRDVTGPPSASMFSPRSDFPISTDNVPKLETSAPHLSVPAAAPSCTTSCQPKIELERTDPLQVPAQQPSGYDLQQMGLKFPPTPSPYLGGYVDPYQDALSCVDNQKLPSQVVYSDPRMLGATPTRPIVIQPQFQGTAPSILTQQFIPAMHMTTPASSHLSMNSAIVQSLGQPRVVAAPSDQSYNHTYSTLISGGYGWHPVIAQDHEAHLEGWMPHQQLVSTTVDCYMCQKDLPHAHSDSVVQGQKDGCSTALANTNPIYHSLCLDDITKFHALASQDQQVVGLISNVQMPYGVGSCPDDAIKQHFVSLSQAKQDALVSKPGNGDTPSVGAITQQFSEQFAPETSEDYSEKIPGVAVGPAIFDERVKAVDFQTENLQIRPGDLFPSNEQGELPVDQHKDDIFVPVPPQTVGRETLPNVELNRSPLVQMIGHMKASEVLPCSFTEVSYQHKVQDVEPVEVVQTSVASNIGSNPPSKLGLHHFDDKSPFHAGDSAYIGDKISPSNNLRDDVASFQTVASSSGSDPTTSSNDVQFSLSSHNWGAIMNDSQNSLFSNQDPWNMRHDAHFPPPKPTKLITKRDVSTCTDTEGEGENWLGHGGEFKTEAHHIDGVQPTPYQIETSKGLSEERIKHQLQATAEGVAASVLYSSVSSNPDFSSLEINVSVSEVNHEIEGQSNNADIQTKMEAVNINPDKTNFGFPLSEGIGRLQIIKNNDLEELRELGSGTIGTVYHGKWRGTDVAIKRINDRCFAGKPSEQQRMRDDFWNEAIKLADLHHPNVVAFYGVVLDGPGGSVATVTEYMVNGSLRTALQKNERNLDKRKRLLIAMDVAFGMEYLHSKNIVHFDLKSDNLLVNLRDAHRPICKVGDLDLSKVKCQTLISGGVRGTLPWMAPELLNGSSSLVSEKVDVFSFGIVMWELLTGEEPYADLHYGAIIGGIVSNHLRPAVPENCDADWRSLMERCWSAEPLERPNFTQIANDLRALAAKVPVLPEGQTPPSNARTHT